ncbi:MAG: DUF1501 domain-containing protein [Planctomycetia bacterium]|nr:DUF1501 domain-containing protein [Planctomycetia bacterium]
MARPGDNFTDGCSELRMLVRKSRRPVLQAGTLGLLGLGLGIPSQAIAASAKQSGLAGSTFGRAKRCIFLFMWGGPSQLDTFDPKPKAHSRCLSCGLNECTGHSNQRTLSNDGTADGQGLPDPVTVSR